MSALDVGAIVAGRYRVERVIGSGAMGTVHEVVRLDFDGRFALKTMRPELARDPQLAERFRREASAAGRIGHPHIVSVVDVGELDDHVPYLVLELLRGQTVGELIASERALAVSRAVRIALGCCDALAAAHEHGVVHRDLKPDNVFLVAGAASPDFVKVLDFGTAKLIHRVPHQAELTREGSMIGTPLYMSPEQIDGFAEIDARSDVYALGVLLFQMLAGHVPFERKRFSALVHAITTEPPPSLRTARPDVPVELEAIVLRALAKAPGDRFESMHALAAALRPFATEQENAPPRTVLTPTPAPVSTPSEIVLPAHSRWRTVGVVSIGIVGLIAAIVFATTGPTHAGPSPRLPSQTEVRSSRAAPSDGEARRPATPSQTEVRSSRAAPSDSEARRPATPSPRDVRSSRAAPSDGEARRRGTPIPTPALATARTITLRNELEASVSVTLVCGGATERATVAAFGARVVSVSAGDCFVRCSSAIGLPRCPVVLRSATASMTIRR